MRNSGVGAWVLLVGMSMNVAPVLAQEPEPEHVTESVELEDDAARGLYEVARAHYSAGRLVEAAHEFEEAYRLSPRPLLLYNAYVAYRDANLRVDSARTLRAYLASDVEDGRRTNLEARLAALEAELSASPPEIAEPTDPPPSSGAPPPPVTEPPVAPPSELSAVAAPITLAIAGAALIGAGITLGLAVSTHDTLTAACPDGACDESRRGEIETLGRLALATDVLGAIGIATAIAGLTLLGVGLAQDAEARVALHAGLGSIVVRGAF